MHFNFSICGWSTEEGSLKPIDDRLDRKNTAVRRGFGEVDLNFGRGAEMHNGRGKIRSGGEVSERMNGEELRRTDEKRRRGAAIADDTEL
jgi:hypothetical protein